VGETGGLFIIDAETDDLTQFTSTVVHASNTLTAAEDAGFILHGDHTFKIVFGGTSAYAYGIKTFTAKTEIYARVYLKIDTLSFLDNEYMILMAFDEVGGNFVMQFRVYGTGTPGQYGYVLMTRDNTGFDVRVNQRDANIFQDDTLYYIEMRWKQGNGTGIENLWIDGIDQGGRTSVTNNNYSITKVYTGAHDYGSTPSAGTVYFDDIKGDAEYIGAYAAGGGGSVVPQIMMHYARLRK
jgi:hypothetical protein